MKKILLLSFALLYSCFAFSQWQQTPQPSGGYVTCFAISGNNIYAGGVGIFVSSDNGSSWAPLPDSGLLNPSIRSLVTKGDTLFTVTDSYGIFLSTDNGNTWADANNGITNKSSITTLTVNGGNIYAGGTGIFVSSDNGASWSSITNDLPTTYTVNSIIVSGNNLFAGLNGGGVYISFNNGLSWWSGGNTSGAGNGLGNKYVEALASNGNYVFAGTGDGVFVSSDNDSSWTQTGKNYFPSGATRAVVASGGYIYAATPYGLYQSPDNGTTWTTSGSLSYVTVLAVNGNNIFAGGTSDGNLFLSTNNGGSWKEIDKGLINSDIANITPIDNNIFIGMNGYGSNKQGYFSFDLGSSWTVIDSAFLHVGEIFCFGRCGNNIFVGTDNGLFSSTNNGSTWQPVYGNFYNSYVTSIFVTGKKIYVGFGESPFSSSIFLSTDSGATWHQTYNGLPTNAGATSFAALNNKVYMGLSYGGMLGDSSGIYMTADDGKHWQAVNGGYSNISVSSLVIKDNTIFAATGNKIISSSDSGADWTILGTGVINTTITGLAVSGKNIIAGTSGEGIFSSSDNGANWLPLNNGLPYSKKINTVAASGSLIYAAVYGQGFWRYDTLGCLIPSLITSGNTTICSGSNTTLTVKGAGSYLWQPGNLTDSIITVSPDTTTQYIVTGTVAGGCANSHAITVKVNPTTNPIVSLPWTVDTLCQGTNTIVSPLVTHWKKGISYQWFVNNILVSTDSSFVDTTLENGDKFTCVISGTNACSGIYTDTSNSVIVTTLPIPSQPGPVQGPALVSNFFTQVYTVAPVPGAISYFWTVPANWYIISGFGTDTITVIPYDSSGYVAVSASNGHCPGPWSQLAVNVKSCGAFFTLGPDSVIAHQWDAVNLSWGVPPLQYTWSWGDGTTSTGATPTHLYQNAGSYTICVSVTDSVGCTSNYCDSSQYVYRTDGVPVTIVVSKGKITGAQQVTEEKNGISIYPNPTNDNVTVDVKGNDGVKELIITSLLGQVMNTAVLNSNSKQFNIQLPSSAGMYFIRIKTEHSEFVEKVVKE